MCPTRLQNTILTVGVLVDDGERGAEAAVERLRGLGLPSEGAHQLPALARGRGRELELHGVFADESPQVGPVSDVADDEVHVNCGQVMDVQHSACHRE